MPKTTASSRRSARRGLDSRLSSIRDLPPESRLVPRGGWVSALREAIGMPAAVLANRMGVAESTVLRLEASERRGTVQLDSLQRAARALDCELVYALVPRTTLEAAVEAQARSRAERELRDITHTMALEAQSAGAEADAALLEELTRHFADKPGLWHGR